MKRDLDLVRKILIQVESIIEPNAEFSVEGYDKAEVNEHIFLCQQAGLIEAITQKNSKGAVVTAIPVRLNWGGHDFLQMARNNKLWEKVKSTIKENAIPATIEVVTTLLKSELKGTLGGLDP